MAQYNHEQSIDGQEPTPVIPKKTVDPDLRNLKEQVREQARQIQDLQREIKQLKNELRQAVNAFNLKRG